MSIEKEVIRSRLQLWRKNLSAETVQAKSSVITDHCIQLIDWKATTSVYVYLPNHKQHEINTWPLIRYIWHAHPHILVAAPHMEGDRMQAYKITETTGIYESAFGIPEPCDAERMNDTDFNVVIVPVTGFTKNGYRLGYGKGHYDRFLDKTKNTITIGLAYDETEIDFLPEPHDIPLHYSITEQRLLQFKI
jgi:5-formyltetrahydrofolate cyclo-ligase